MKTMTLAIMMLLGVCVQAKTAAHIKQNVSFRMILDEAIKGLPYVLIYQEGVYQYDAALVGHKKIQPVTIKGNTCFFDLKQQDKPMYFSIILLDQNDKQVAVNSTYHFEPGDQIEMIIKPTKFWGLYKIGFSGIGSSKYRCKNEMEMMTDKIEVNPAPIFPNATKSMNNAMSRLGKCYSLIEKYKPEMSVYSYNLLHADVLGKMGSRIFEDLRDTLVKLKSTGDTAAFNTMVSSFRTKFEYDFTKNVPENILFDSKNYASFLLTRFYTESVMDFGSINYKAIYKQIASVDNYPLRDKLLLCFFVSDWSRFGDDYTHFLNSSLDLIKDKNILARMKIFNNNKVGSKAQNFNLADQYGKMVSLSDFKGKVVFIDFWYTGCVGCKGYYRNVLSKVEERYANNANIVFITISADKKETWLATLKKGDYTSAKVINLYTNGERYDHQIIKSYNVSAYPRPIVISKSGKIVCTDAMILRNIDGLVGIIEKEVLAKR